MAATAFNPERRNLLRGKSSTKGGVVRPPRVLDDAAFVAACGRCDACITACPQGVLHRGSGGYTELSFAERGGDWLSASTGRA